MATVVGLNLFKIDGGAIFNPHCGLQIKISLAFTANLIIEIAVIWNHFLPNKLPLLHSILSRERLMGQLQKDSRTFLIFYEATVLN